MLCGGACGFASCPQQKCASFSGDAGDPTALAMCLITKSDGSVAPSLLPCGQIPCSDGSLCALTTSEKVQSSAMATFALMDCASEDFGVLFHHNGADSLVRYADRAVYDGTPIPAAPAVCPTANGVSLCGGGCGSCPNTAPFPAAGYVCAGRSPLHPIGLCVDVQSTVFGQGFPCTRNTSSEGACTASALSCFTFKVDASSQSIADANSFEIDSAACAAAVSNYPGGGFCTCPP